MFLLVALSAATFIVGAGLTLISLFLGKKSDGDREKYSPYECGFEPFSRGRAPLSIRFFVISVVFLVFDVEIALLIPLIPTGESTILGVWSGLASLFLIILAVGVFYEWRAGALDWKS